MNTSCEHTAESVYETFLHIDQGLCTNAIFSNANVVMISKELYDTLIEGQQK